MMVKAKGVNVGISTIYYWIHHGKLGWSKQDLLYPRKGKALKKQASTNFNPPGQSIEQRPEAINLRLENGHYEIDTVLLTRVKNYCLLVLTDRRTRHQIIRLIPNKSAEAVNQALKLILKQDKILSITADNGTEFNRLSDVFSEEHIYYAHPYASWEIEPYFSKHRTYKWPKRVLVNETLYVTKTGCQWRMLPHDFPLYLTVWSFFRRSMTTGWFQVNGRWYYALIAQVPWQ